MLTVRVTLSGKMPLEPGPQNNACVLCAHISENMCTVLFPLGATLLRRVHQSQRTSACREKGTVSESIALGVRVKRWEFVHVFLSLSLLFCYQTTYLEFPSHYQKHLCWDGGFCWSFKCGWCRFQVSTGNTHTHDGSVFMGSKLIWTLMQRRQMTAESSANL